MKKFFKITAIFICACCLLFSSIPVSAINNPNNDLADFSQIYPSNITENVSVYENDDTGEKCAIFNPDDFEFGEKIVLYVDEETGDKVQVTVTPKESSISTYGSYDSGWSGGYIPAGSYTFTPEINASSIKGILFYLTYSVDVTAYHVKIHDAYNTYYHALLANITSCETKVVNSSATNTSPARATCQFTGNIEEYGIIAGSFSGYLTFQVNQLGQIRVTWYW